MKNSATSSIFTTAMASATTTLNGPRSTIGHRRGRHRSADQQPSEDQRVSFDAIDVFAHGYFK